MAAVSEAMIYNPRIVPSYVSSNGYYGYIPPRNEIVEIYCNYQQAHSNNNKNNSFNNHNNELEHNQQEPVRIANSHSVSVGASSLHQDYNEQHSGHNNSSDMETDGNEMYIQDIQHCQNNHCVIPETTRCLTNGCDRNVNNDGIDPSCCMIIDDRNNVTPISQNRENRKRSHDDTTVEHHVHGDQSGRIKKLRQGGGNSRVFHGTDRTRKDGSAAMPNESSSLCLVPTITSSQKLYSNVANNCYGLVTAGTCPLINHKYRHNVHETKECSNTSTYSVDCEQMLMETHGCSAYHHYRHYPMDNNVIETEF